MPTFAEKVMKNQLIKEVLSSEELTEQFYNILFQEMFRDDEPSAKKGRHLLLAMSDNPKADDICLALTGWKFETLIDMLT